MTWDQYARARAEVESLRVDPTVYTGTGYGWCDECNVPYRPEELIRVGDVYLCRWHERKHREG